MHGMRIICNEFLGCAPAYTLAAVVRIAVPAQTESWQGAIAEYYQRGALQVRGAGPGAVLLQVVPLFVFELAGLTHAQLQRAYLCLGRSLWYHVAAVTSLAAVNKRTF